MSEDHDKTVVEVSRSKLNSLLNKTRYEGQEKRAPEPLTLSTIIPYAALIGTMVSGVAGYVTLHNDVGYLAKEQTRVEAQHKEDMDDYLEWNKAISERLRELERQ